MCFMVILTNKNQCTFVLSTLGTEQRYKECACVGYALRNNNNEGLSGRVRSISVLSMTEE